MKESQREWLKFRDKELEFLRQYTTDLQGTMYRVIAAGRSMEMVKKRANGLKDYYETITVP